MNLGYLEAKNQMNCHQPAQVKMNQRRIHHSATSGKFTEKGNQTYLLVSV